MKTHAQIKLNGLELAVNLGWPSGERKKPQIITLNVIISFPHPPQGCITDQLTDTYCYDTLVTAITTYVAERHFRLIEHLGYELYHFIQNMLSPDLFIQVQLTKKPAILNLTGGVTFSFGNLL